MVYAALLRGINVGGNNKVEMKRLRETFASAGMGHVQSYINSGNIIFSNSSQSRDELTQILEKAVFEDVSLDLRILILGLKDFDRIMAKLPEEWENGEELKCDVCFLWDEIDRSSIIKEIGPKEGIDTLIYVKGAILAAVKRESVTRSAMMKLTGKPLYQKMTIRNVNSARKIYALMQQVSQEEKKGEGAKAPKDQSR